MRFNIDLLAWPGALWLALGILSVAAFAGVLVWASLRRARAEKRFGEPKLVANLVTSDATSRRAVKGVLMVIALALALVAFVLAGIALVVAIERRGGGEAVLDAAPVKPAPAPAARAYLIDRTHGVVPRQLADRLLLELAPGAILQGGVLDQLGLHDGDVIRGVNGMEISAPDLAKQLKPATRFTIDYDRGGSALQLMLEIR